MKLSGVTNILANATNPNVLAGSVLEFVQRPSIVKFWVVGDAGGAARATITSGTDVLMEESPVSRAARMPLYNDDLTAQDAAVPPDRLKLALRNTSGAAIDVFWAVEVIAAR